MIIKSGDADGQLAGARNTTGNVLRPALQIIKTAPGITCVSGAMLLLTHAPECGDNVSQRVPRFQMKRILK